MDSSSEKRLSAASHQLNNNLSINTKTESNVFSTSPENEKKASSILSDPPAVPSGASKPKSVIFADRVVEKYAEPLSFSGSYDLSLNSKQENVLTDHISEPEKKMNNLVDQIKSPFEDEAEMAILSAIEDAEMKHSVTDANTDRDKILSQVPDKSMPLFTSEEEKGPKKNPQEPTSFKPRFKNAAQRVINANKSNNVDAENSEKVPGLEIESSTFAASKSLKLFDIAFRLTSIDTQHRLARDDSVALPSVSNDEIDPESLIPQSETEREEIRETPLMRASVKNSSSRCKCIPCCFPCLGVFRLMGDKRRAILNYLKVWSIFSILSFAIAILLFYEAGNPKVGESNEHYAWVFLFIIRLSITFLLAKITQFFIIDVIAMETDIIVRFLGRTVTLMIILSKGWPSLVSFWGIWNFILNFGRSSFAKNWCFRLPKYQNKIFDICDEAKIPTSFPHSTSYRNVLITMVVIGFVVIIKRLFVSLLLGKKKYVTYGPHMEKLMKKILLISEIAVLAREIEFEANTQMMRIIKAPLLGNGGNTPTPRGHWIFNKNMSNSEDAEEDEESITGSESQDKHNKSNVYELSPGKEDNAESNDYLVGNRDERDRKNPNEEKSVREGNLFQFYNPFKSILPKKEIKNMINTPKNHDLEHLLGEWVEPEVTRKALWNDTSVQKILQFRESLRYLDGSYPLSAPFGLADNRKSCCCSAEKVYSRLLMKTPGAESIHFETISMLALGPDGRLQKDKARALIRLLRPDREGKLSLLDFVKSCDKVYRRARVFRASTLTSAQLDDAFEQVFNFIFYIIVVFAIMLFIGVDTGRLFAFSGAFLSLSFMFGGSASRFLEGVLLVLARQPYDVGDRIAISNPQNDTSSSGSTTWFVENISLFQTTVRNAATNEIATYSNSSLAHCRIINAARSKEAITYVNLKFGIDVPYSKVMICKDVVEKFVKERPREFTKLAAFRATNVEVDLGYINYCICLQHVDSWQNIGDVLNAKSKVASFCLEVQKKMGMRFVAPPMPVDLSMSSNKERSELEGLVASDQTEKDTSNSAQYHYLANMFDSTQQTSHDADD